MVVRTSHDEMQVTVPRHAHLLDGFRRWVVSDNFPERGGVSFVQGEIIVDMSPEKAESHNQVKAEIDGVLGPLIKAMDWGKYYPDGLWLTNDEADLSTEPDATFCSWECLTQARAMLVKTTADDGIEMRGSPDWVLEIVSDSSERKDAHVLAQCYHQAGVREYWLIDARGECIEFSVRHWQPAAFVTAEPVADWHRSLVFQRQFRLTRVRDRIGGWSYTLDMRDL
jgi:Uma2 family endonuclease